MDPVTSFSNGKGEKFLFLFDTRKSDAFEKEHIPGAINLPHRELDETSTKGWTDQKLMPVYCKGTGCNAIDHGALKMAKLGFKVKEVFGRAGKLESRRLLN